MGRKWFVLAALTVLGYFFAATLRKQGSRTVRDDWPTNFAHRGDSTRAPENTLDAFQRAVEAGAGGLELDVHLTRDGHVVVIHDPTLDRTTNTSGAVAGMMWEKVREADAGYNFSPDGGATHPYRGLGLRIPTLAEVLREFPGVVLNIDLKADRPGIEAAVLKLLRDSGAEGRALVVSSRL